MEFSEADIDDELTMLDDVLDTKKQEEDLEMELKKQSIRKDFADCMTILKHGKEARSSNLYSPLPALRFDGPVMGECGNASGVKIKIERGY
uniref:Uncharacterized protein n=1 Tax=Cannabis sativa TaxID=3483 RepID=A0A803QFQ9_CANSA